MKSLFIILFSIPGLLLGQTIPVEEVIPEEEYELELEEQTISTPCESEAQFPGGEIAMMKFILENLETPSTEHIIDLSKSVVYVRFLVLKTGKLTDIQIVRGISESFDNEVLRLISSMPTWKPAEFKGKCIDSRYTLPIRFCFRG